MFRLSSKTALAVGLAFCMVVAVGSGGETGNDFLQLLNRLNSRDSDTREKARQELKKCKVPMDKDSIVSLARLLESDDIDLNDTIRSALKRTGRAGVPALVSLLATEKSSTHLCCEILQVIEEIGPDANLAIDAILKRLQDQKNDGDENFYSARALTAIGPSTILPIVQTYTKCRNECKESLMKSLRRTVLNDTLSRCRLAPKTYDKIVPFLAAGLQSSNEEIKLDCVKALGGIRPNDPEVILAIARLGDKDDPVVKMEVATSLGLIGAPSKSAKALLARLLQDSNDRVLWHALVACQMIGMQDTFAQRAAEIADTEESYEVREQAVRLIGQAAKPPQKAIDVIEKRFRHDENLFVRLLAAQALERLDNGHMKARRFILDSCKDDNPDIRGLVVRMLPTLSNTDDHSISVLGDRLNDPEASVCMEAVRSVTILGKKAIKLKDALRRGMAEPPHARLELLFAAALLKIESNDIKALKTVTDNPSVLLELSRNPDKEWRLFGIEAIGNLKSINSSLHKELVERVRDEDAAVRLAADRVLKKLGSE